MEFPDFPYLGIWTKAGQGDARYLLHRALVRAARRSVLPARAVREARRAHA